MRKSHSKKLKLSLIISWFLIIITELEPTRATLLLSHMHGSGGQRQQTNCLNDEFENYGCACGRGFYQPFSDSFVCKNGIYSLACDLNQTRIESVNKLDYLIALVEETSSASEVCWSAFEFENALKLSSHTFSYLQFRPIDSSNGASTLAADAGGIIRLRLSNVFEIDSFAFSSIKLRWSDALSISLENSGLGIFSSLILKRKHSFFVCLLFVCYFSVKLRNAYIF